MGIENPVHLAFIAIVALLVLGPKRLPELARALGHGIREFREAVSLGSVASPQPSVEQPDAQASATAADVAAVVDPGESVRSGDAPDRRPL